MMINTISDSLLVSAVLSSVLLVLVLTMRKVFAKTMNYKILAFLWMLLLIRLLMPFTFEAPVSVFSAYTSPAQDTQIEPIAAEYTIANGSNTAEYEYTPDDAALRQDYQTTPTQNTSGINVFIGYLKQLNLINTALVIWLLGAAFVLLKSAVQMTVFLEITKYSNLCCREDIISIVKEHREKLKLKPIVIIKECAYISTPVIMGASKPVILIPEGMFESLDRKSISMIILHEMCHIKSGDLIKNKLWLIAKAFNWYNPLVWIAYKAFLDDLETTCDQNVLKQLKHSARGEYLDALLHTAKLIKPVKATPQALCFASDKSKLRKRVETMTTNKKPRAGVNIITILIIIVFALACFTTACTGSQSSNETAMDILQETPLATPTPIPESTALSVSEDFSVNDLFNALYYDGRTPSTAEEISQCETIVLMNVDDFSFLEGMDNIKRIMISDYFEDTVSGDISPLATLANLESVTLENSNVEGDIQALSSLTKLKYISMSRTNITGDISSLAALTNLETLYMSDTAVKGDISALKDLVYLTRFSFSVTRVSGDIASLESLINLRYIALDETNVTGDISVLENFRMLEEVYVGSTQVTGDISVFASLPYIDWAALEMTEIFGDVSAFSQSENLVVLYIFATDVSGDIETLAKLKNLEQLMYDGSKVTGELIIPYPAPKG